MLEMIWYPDPAKGQAVTRLAHNLLLSHRITYNYTEKVKCEIK